MKFRVWIRSTPGFYAQYDGYVDVVADDAESAGAAALRKLKATAFPDRSSAFWRIEKVEVAANGKFTVQKTPEVQP